MTPARAFRLLAVCGTALLVTAIGTVPASGGAFPGANGRLAYTTYVSGNPESVYTVWPNGTGRRLAIRNAAYPAWSPDGTRIAFERWGTDGYLHIYVKNMQTGVVTQITSNRRLDRFPAWSPDGRRIAFSTYLPGTGSWDGIYSIGSTRPFGTRQLILAPQPFSWAEDLAWSPDGNRIAFSYYVDGYGTNIAVMPIGHPEQQPTMLTTDGYAENPTWSPGGRKIAFSAGWLSVMNADGTGRRDYFSSESAIYGLAWSPDGRKIAAQIDWEYTTVLITMNPWTGAWLTQDIDAPIGSGPDWQPLPR